MQKIGTNAVDASRAGEPERQKFQLLGARFLDELLRHLSGSLSAALSLSDLRQGSESFARFCAGTQAQLVFVLEWTSAATLVFRAGSQTARLIVDAMFGGSGEKTPSGAEPLLSATESRVLMQILGDALTAAANGVFGRVFGGRVIKLMQNIDHANLIDDALGSEELILTAEASGALNGQRGDFALGLPFSLLAQLQSSEPPADLDSGDRPGLRNVGSLAAVPIELRAVLAERELSLAEVRRLKPGTVIILQRLRPLPKAQLCAEGQVLFRGTIIEHQGWHNFLIQQVESADVERAA